VRSTQSSFPFPDGLPETCRPRPGAWPIQPADDSHRCDNEAGQQTGGIALATSPGSVWVVDGAQLTRVDVR
jgi:hypothetical protein